MPATRTDVEDALGRGDPDAVAALIAAGADLHYKDDQGYDALIHAVHGRDVTRDERLLDLLHLLISNAVDLNGITTYGESALRVLSRIGRFDGAQLLIAHGADSSQLQWSPLIEAVALGSLEDVERLARGGAALEDTDWWSRTAWLVTLLTGDRAKAQLLRTLGANTDARGRCGARPLSYAIAGHHPEMVRWLLAIGQDVEQTDDFDTTPLMTAVEEADLGCIEPLLEAGANVDRESRTGSVLSRAGTREVARRLLDAGADPLQLSQAGHRTLCGLPEPTARLLNVSQDEFRGAHSRVFGAANPELMRKPFWEGMVRAGISAFEAAELFDPGSSHAYSPVWCAMRFGQSITFLSDGRIVQIAGEHEDYYDPDFCIYNDVFVHGVDDSIAIFGYPEKLFPPTDFHTATLVDGGIYVIGSLGYLGARRHGETPVYRLDVETFRMQPIKTHGELPGWIYEHRADRIGPSLIRISGGKVVTSAGGAEKHTENTTVFTLELRERLWRRES
jgi:ankyrin repeat protein